jgi:hypothetical protein
MVNITYDTSECLARAVVEIGGRRVNTEQRGGIETDAPAIVIVVLA